MKKRNGIVDFMKFVFSIIIALFHYGQFHPKEVGSVFMHCGYIGVEFYFIVSGYLLMKKAHISECGENVFKDNLTMIKNRYIRFFPRLFLAVIISNIYIHSTQGSTLNIVVHDALYSLSDLFLLQMLGFSGFWATGVSWYLSSLLIITFVLYPILHKYKEKFLYYIAPIIVLFIYGAIAQNNITINCITERYGFLQGGILRGLAGILLGCISYFIAKNIKENINLYNKQVLYVLEMLGYILSIVFAVFYKRWNEMDFVIVFLLFISITISFSSQTLSATIFKNKIFNPELFMKP